jgi:hypothetical protein
MVLCERDECVVVSVPGCDPTLRTAKGATARMGLGLGERGRRMERSGVEIVPQPKPSRDESGFLGEAKHRLQRQSQEPRMAAESRTPGRGADYFTNEGSWEFEIWE